MTMMTPIQNLEFEMECRRRRQAIQRLVSLSLDPALINDESGQTTAEEHEMWLLRSTDAEILQWAQDLNAE